MRYTQTFIPTVRELPAEATIPSHILMVRSGMIRQLVSGVYSYLPLGYRALRKAEQIIREEMDRVGASELHMPVLIPVDLFRKTNRLEAFGNILMQFKDQHNSELSLGPTHEEVVTQIVADNIKSYKQLPLSLYQIQTKFRDEERPKSGVLRTREFLMKDAYSFHTSVEDLNATYGKMYQAYEKIFKRCGLPSIAVEAESGPIGGSASHEFMVLTDVGEDRVVTCTNCDYSANVEKAERKQRITEASPSDDLPELKEVYTPDCSSIEQVSEFLKCETSQLIKTLIYQGGDEVIVALVRGDHEVNESKLAHAAGVDSLHLADNTAVERLTRAKTGFAGPVNLQAAKILVDYDILTIADGVTGANKDDTHLTGVVPGRDFGVDEEKVADIRNVIAGDLCPHCGSEMKIQNAIEVGHVFKLGTKYSSALKACFLDTNGKSSDIIMGCYGIGVNRILAGVIESQHDDNGIIWPISIAPYQVTILALNPSNEEVKSAADKLHDELTEAGVDVLYDDRDIRPGVKFKDADLLGIPIRVTIGPKGVAEGKVEIKLRREEKSEKVESDRAFETVRDTVNRMFQELQA